MLTLERRNYSVHPWRISLTTPDGQRQELRYFSFPRKRDGLPFLAALQTCGADWNQPPATWAPEVREQIDALITQTPGWQVEQRALEVKR